jgi:hypothetical protein
MKNENNLSYYEGNDINKPTNKTIKIFLKAKDLDSYQSGMLIKGLIDNYISNLDYDIDNLYSNNTELDKYKFFLDNTKDIKAIKSHKINTEQRTKDLFYKSRASEILNKYKLKILSVIYISTAVLLYYLTTNILIVIIYLISTMLSESVINKKVNNRILKKAKEDIDKASLYNKT